MATEGQLTGAIQPMSEYHGKFVAAIGKHPERYAKLVAGLVVASIVLLALSHYYKRQYKKCKNPKSNFEAAGIHRISNLSTGSNNPLWSGGSADAGEGGYLDRDTTVTQTAVYVPSRQPLVQRVVARRARAMRMAGMAGASKMGLGAPMTREGMYSPPCQSGDLQVPVGYDADTNPIFQCARPREITDVDIDGGNDTEDYEWDLETCANQWDPNATIEAQALAAGGGLDPPTYGSRRLDTAIEGAYDTNRGLSDAQLTTLMRFGGAP